MRIGSRNIAHILYAMLWLWILAFERADATLDPRTETVFEYCLTSEYPNGSGFQHKLKPFLQNLTENVSKNGKPYVVDSYRVNNRSNVYGLAECRADLNSGDCKGCISVAVNSILNACQATGGVIRVRGCYLRYSARPFFISRTWDADYQAVCNVQNNRDPNFPSAVHKILADVTTAPELAASGSADKSSVLPSSMRLYAFARCNIWHPHMSGEACGKCLSSAKKGLSLSCGEKNLGARIWSHNCFLRYEAYDFFSMGISSSLPTLLISPFIYVLIAHQIISLFLRRLPAQPDHLQNLVTSPVIGYFLHFRRHTNILIMCAVQSTAKRERSKTLIMVGIPVAAMIVLGLMILLAWKSLGGFQWKWLHRDLDEDWNLLASTVNPKLLFKYETLRRATGNFHFKNRLGIGGFGSVYKAMASLMIAGYPVSLQHIKPLTKLLKYYIMQNLAHSIVCLQGILPDGTEVAVKRLFVSPTQGGLEFMNEVNIISSVQHRNLVKLVGCSIHGPESFLVYEFLPNRSLDKILFGIDANHLFLCPSSAGFPTHTQTFN